MRFQLDPRAEAPERPAPPPPGPLAPATAAPDRAAPGPAPALPASRPRPAAKGVPLPRPRPQAGPATAEDRRRRTRLYAMLAVLVLLLLGGGTGALYAAEMAPFEYPRRYMLEGDELPRDMRMAAIPRDIQREMGLTENPGRISSEQLDRFGEGPAPQPEEGWAEFLSPTSSQDPVMVMALRFEDEDDARSWTSLLSLRCSSVGAVLRDGDVAVVVAADSTTGKAYVGRVVASLRSEAPGLTVVCGAART